MMPRNPRTNLFRGTGYEYYVISQLLIKEYEAYKLPVDFGFDLAVCKPSDSGEYSADKEHDIYYFQIKSAQLNTCEQAKSKAGNRSDKRVKFTLNKRQIEKISAGDNNFLVCCLVERNESSESERLCGTFCLGQAQVEYLKDNGFFQESGKNYLLTVIFSPQATLEEQYMEVIKQLKEEKYYNSEVLQRLEGLLGKSNIVNNHSNNNIYFVKKEKNQSEIKYFLNPYFYKIENFERMIRKKYYDFFIDKSKRVKNQEGSVKNSQIV